MLPCLIIPGVIGHRVSKEQHLEMVWGVMPNPAGEAIRAGLHAVTVWACRAIVGAGPTGLSAAYALVRRGYGVTVYEAMEVPGGMMTLGIPEYRLRPTPCRQERARVAAEGEEACGALPVAEVGRPALRRAGTRRGIDWKGSGQRVALRYHLDGLDLAETTKYIAHHLALVGRSDTLISDDAVALVHETSRGLPRAVNNLATQALTAAFAAAKSIVDQSSAHAAITEVAAE